MNTRSPFLWGPHLSSIIHYMSWKKKEGIEVISDEDFAKLNPLLQEAEFEASQLEPTHFIKGEVRKDHFAMVPLKPPAGL